MDKILKYLNLDNHRKSLVNSQETNGNYKSTLKKLLIAAIATAPLISCTGPINNETLKDMPTKFICRLLDSDEYISLPSEQRAIYTELEKRNEECIDSTQVLILK